MNESLKQFEVMLTRHDSFFEYSDDHRVWSKGRESQDAIIILRDKLGEEGRKLYEAHCPRSAFAFYTP